MALASIPKISSELKVHEWLAVIILISTLTGLSAMAYLSKSTIGDKERLAPAFLTTHGKIEVLVKGAVIHPGIYCVPSMTTLAEVLIIAQVAPEADLRRYQLDNPIKRGRSINIPSREMITIDIKGAVKNPTKVTVPKGSKLEDLLNLIDFTDHADLKYLQKKRKLKSGEEITVPALKSPY